MRQDSPAPNYLWLIKSDLSPYHLIILEEVIQSALIAFKTDKKSKHFRNFINECPACAGRSENAV